MKYLRYILVAAVLIAGGATATYGSENLNGNITPEPQSASIRTAQGCIEITVTDQADHEVTVYGLTGQAVKHLAVPEGTTRIELKPGYYIVRVDGQSVRVVVK